MGGGGGMLAARKLVAPTADLVVGAWWGFERWVWHVGPLEAELEVHSLAGTGSRGLPSH